MKTLNTIALLFTFLISSHALEMKISKNDFIKRHKYLVEILVDLEKNQDYPGSMIKEGELISRFKLYHLFLSEAYANTNELCFFGGWPSLKQGSKCNTPWKHRGNNSLQKYGTSYDQEHYCSRDPLFRNRNIPSEKLFRCNPTLFGTAPSGKGKCIQIENYNNVTKQCFEETKNNIDDVFNRYLTDETFKENYLNTARDISSFCQNPSNSTYDACNYLMASINEMNGKLCDAVPEPTLGENVVRFLSTIVDKIDPPPALEIAEPTVSHQAPTESIRPTSRPTRPQVTATRTNCNRFYDRFLSSGVPEKALKQALTFYERNRNTFSNKWISIADYTDNSRDERFYMFNVETGEMRTHKVSHGSGDRSGQKHGDPNHDGNLNSCSYNGSRTNMTRPGFFKVAEPYVSPSHTSSWTNIGGRFNGLRMDGLSGSLNDHARAKGVVMHGANYNRGDIMGRSYGCPAFTPNQASSILNTIKNGSLFYSYVGRNCQSDQNRVDQTLPNWERTCAAN